MVERLKQAIEKARLTRGIVEPEAAGNGHDVLRRKVGTDTSLPVRSEFDWHLIPEVAIDPQRLQEARISGPRDQAEVVRIFEGLGARLARICAQKKWTRIALTAPTSGCGTTTFAIQLAFSLALSGQLRVLLMDLNLGHPAIARRLGLDTDQNISPTLVQTQPLEKSLYRLGANLLIAANAAPFRQEVASRPEVFCAKLIEQYTSVLRPDIVLLDLAPVLESDDTAVLLPLADAALLIASADRTNAPDIAESARTISSTTSYLGTALNRSRDRMVRRSQHELA